MSNEIQKLPEIQNLPNAEVIEDPVIKEESPDKSGEIAPAADDSQKSAVRMMTYNQIKEIVDCYEDTSTTPKKVMMRSKSLKTIFDLAAVAGIAGLGVLNAIISPFVSAGLGVVGAASATVRRSTVGKAKEGDDAQVASCRQEFSRVAKVYAIKQIASSVVMAMAGVLFVRDIVSPNEQMGGELLWLGVAAVGAVAGIWARKDAVQMNVYESAIELGEQGTLSIPKPIV